MVTYTAPYTSPRTGCQYESVYFVLKQMTLSGSYVILTYNVFSSEQAYLDAMEPVERCICTSYSGDERFEKFSPEYLREKDKTPQEEALNFLKDTISPR